MSNADAALAATIIFEPMPKSICKFLAVHVKDYLNSAGLIDYSKETYHAFKLKPKVDVLETLKIAVKSTLTRDYNAVFAQTAMSVITLGNVNSFIKNDHIKNIRSPVQIAADKLFNSRLSAAAREQLSKTKKLW